MMRRLLSALVAVLSAAAMTGCGRRITRVDAGDARQILHMGNGAEPQDLDPQVVTGVSEHHIIMSLLEGLVTEDPKDLHPVPGVAERWDISSDGTVYTFHLRSNAKWSNGDPVVAEDFVRSYQRILTPSLGAEYSYMLYPVAHAEEFNKGSLKDFNQVGIHALDPSTLRITLKSSTPYFLSLLSHTSWFPVHIPTVQKFGDALERGNRWTRPGHYVGNGAFVLKEWKINDVIVVKKNPSYWDSARVRLNEIHFYPIESSYSEERAFRAGQLHLTYTLPNSKTDVYHKEHPELLRIDPYLGVYFYMFNVRRPPLDDKRVRRALAMAINRQAIVTSVTRGGQQPAHHFTPPGAGGYYARARIPTDIAAAQKTLADAGYANGQGLPPIEILFNTNEDHRTIAEAVQEMWKLNLHIDTRLINEEWKVFLDSQKEGNYMVSRFGWIGDYSDPNSFLDLWVTGGGNNRTGWSNRHYDELIEQAAHTADPQKRFECFQQAEAILMDEVPIAPIYFYTQVFLIRPSVHNWFPTILNNHPYKYVYLDSTAP